MFQPRILIGKPALEQERPVLGLIPWLVAVILVHASVVLVPVIDQLDNNPNENIIQSNQKSKWKFQNNLPVVILVLRNITYLMMC